MKQFFLIIYWAVYCKMLLEFLSYMFLLSLMDKTSMGPYLVCKLMGDNLGDTQFVWSWGLFRVKKEAWLSVGGQPPVLHCTWLEVRDSSQVCREQQQRCKYITFICSAFCVLHICKSF